MLSGVPFPADLADTYRRAGYWQGRPLGDLLVEAADRTPDKIAVVARSTAPALFLFSGRGRPGRRR
jgi:non-ribosomal peptide synthetase component E (peptide arylation enzyme)